MKLQRHLILAVMALIFLFGCGSGNKVAGPCSSDSSLQFRIASVNEGLPLDSLFLAIAVGKDGKDQEFAANLKTGVSSANITATQGQPYKLHFVLYSAGHRIGEGTSSGVLSCELDVDLDPVWDEVETGKAKAELNQGILLPNKLSVYFTQAVAGKELELPLDSLTTGTYRWYVKEASGDSINLANENLLEGDGPVVRFIIPDTLAGRQIVLRLQVVIKGQVKEERIWMISVLEAKSLDRLSRVTVRVDSSDKEGTSQSYSYTDGRLTLIRYYDSLSPAKDQNPTGLDSLYYDEQGRRTQKIRWLSDSTKIDSLFAYDSNGNLSVIEYRKGNDVVIDSLTYLNGKLSADFRSVAGKRVERIHFLWTGTQNRIDSVFSVEATGDKWRGFVENTYKNDSLIERKISGVQGGLQPKTLERIAYNGLGSRAYREVYTAGASLSLDRTEAYAYDLKGRQISLLIRDEVTGYTINYYAYEYSTPASAKGSAIGFASQSAGTSLESVSVLADIRSALSSMDPKPTHRLLAEGIQ